MTPQALILKIIGSALLLLLCLVRADCHAAEGMEQARVFVDAPVAALSGASDILVQANVRDGGSASTAYAELGAQPGIGNVSSAKVFPGVSAVASPERLSPSGAPQEQDFFSSLTPQSRSGQNSAPRKQYTPLRGSDSTEGLSGGADTPSKRKARLQGMRMRMLYGPEATYHGSFIRSASEYGSRHVAGAVAPVSERWEIAALNHVSLFSLKSGDHRAGRESMLVRVGMNPGSSLRPWFALTPSINFGDARGEHVGIATGVSKSWKDGTSLATEVYAWRPWDEGYYTMIEDGQRHGAALAFTLPVTKKLTVSTRAQYEALELGSRAKSGAQYAGSRYGWNARAYYRLLQREAAFMGHGFRNDDVWNEYLVGSELGVFTHLDWQRYTKPAGFDALHPVPQAFAQQLGLSYQHAFSPHLGLTAESYIGRDPDRDLRFGDLLGVNMRLTTILNPHVRIWCALGYIKTGTTLESDGGEENTVSFGVNYNF